MTDELLAIDCRHLTHRYGHFTAVADVSLQVRQGETLGLLGTNVPANPQYEPATPTTGMNDPTGDARYPVIGGNDVPRLDLTGGSLGLANGTLTAAIHVSNLSNAAIQNAFTAVPGALPERVGSKGKQRWLLPLGLSLEIGNEVTVYLRVRKSIFRTVLRSAATSRCC